MIVRNKYPPKGFVPPVIVLTIFIDIEPSIFGSRFSILVTLYKKMNKNYGCNGVEW